MTPDNLNIQQAARQQMVSTVYNSPTVKCQECGSKVFKEGMILKKVSSLVSGSGKDELVPIPVFVCDKCGKIPDEFLERPAAKQILGEDKSSETNLKID